MNEVLPALTRSSLPAIAAVAALAVAGCGGDEEEPAAEAAATVEVVETDFEIEPADATVDEEGTIEFQITNEGETVHSLEVETPEEEFVSDQIGPGESTSFTADLAAGEYVWYCPIGNHRELGMEGTITVGAGGGSAGEEDSGEDGPDDAGGGAPY